MVQKFLPEVNKGDKRVFIIKVKYVELLEEYL